MAAALETEARGFSTAIIEREEELGGILLQCIHNGFGLQEFKKEMTGSRVRRKLRGPRGKLENRGFPAHDGHGAHEPGRLEGNLLFLRGTTGS